MKLSNPIDARLSGSFSLKSISEDDGGDTLIIKGFANTTTRDRVGDVIPKEAWESPSAMTNYQKNPIILAHHDYTAPIGKMVAFEVREEGLYIEAEISKYADESIRGLIQDGVLKTFSVGFSIKDAEWKQEHDIYLIKELELYEVSVVAVPCNQDSTFEVSKSMGEDYKQFKQKLRAEAGVDSSETPNDNAQLNSLLEKLAKSLNVI